MNRPLLTALQKLLNAEGGHLSASALTPAQQQALDEFRQRTQALMQQRSGRGRIFRIVHRGVVEQHLAEHAPLAGTKATSIGWYSGHLRIRLIDWLTQQPESTITLFPDYDGVGLHNYLRLKRQLGPRVHFWLMPDWQEKLQRFGSNRLWQDTQKDFQAALRGMDGKLADEPELKQLMDAMQTSGLALEQEAVWL